ncbi:hypothetical protein SRABI26_04401 [Arthrobacter sp. Bi26]|nr:hypothetical protein SRABI26_04401 [Arthrobacter sp. Bi26]
MTTPNRPAAARRTAPSKVPAGAKKPADHQPAKEDVAGPKDYVITWPNTTDPDAVTHEYVIAGENLDDAELVEHFTDNNAIAALRIMLGPEGWAEYKENARGENGRVTASGATEFLDYALSEMKRGNS